MARYPVSISFSGTELKQLNQLAKRYHQTRSAFVKAALSEYIRRLQFERLSQAGQALAETKDFYTDEDIFRVVS